MPVYSAEIAQLAADYEKEDIEQAILYGSGFQGGKQRTIDFFADEYTQKEKAVFLNKEYGKCISMSLFYIEK